MGIKYVYLLLIFFLSACTLATSDNAAPNVGDPGNHGNPSFNTIPDEDGDGITADIDPNDNDKAVPAPVIWLNSKDGFINNNTKINLLPGRSFRISQVMGYTTAYPGIRLYYGDFKFVNGAFTWINGSGASSGLNVIDSAFLHDVYDQYLNNKEVVGSVYAAYNQTYNTNFFNIMGVLLDAGINSGNNFQTAFMNKMNSKFSINDLRTALLNLNDSLPITFQATAFTFMKDYNIPITIEFANNWLTKTDPVQKTYSITMKADIVDLSTNYYVQNYIISHFKWDLYKLEIDRDYTNSDVLTKPFWELLMHYGDDWQSMVNSITKYFGIQVYHHNQLNSQDTETSLNYYGAGTLTIKPGKALIDDPFSMRFNILHGYCEAGNTSFYQPVYYYVTLIDSQGNPFQQYTSSNITVTVPTPRVDYITLLRVYPEGLRANTNATTPNNLLIYHGRNINIVLNNNVTNLKFIISNTNVLQSFSNKSTINNGSLSIKTKTNTGGQIDVLAYDLYNNKNPRGRVFHYYTFYPQFSVTNKSNQPEYTIPGDNLGVNASLTGLTGNIHNYNADAFVKVINDGSPADITVNNPANISGVYTVQNTNPIDVNLWIEQTVLTTIKNTFSNNYASITNIIRPEFVIKGLKDYYTNGELITNLTFELAPEYSYLSNKFSNMTVTWIVTNNTPQQTIARSSKFQQGIARASKVSPFGGQSAIVGQLSYNGVLYSSAANIYRVPGNLGFGNIADGDYYYPALGAWKLDIYFVPGTSFTLSTASPNGRFSLNIDGPFTPSLKIDSMNMSGKTNIYYTDFGTPGNTPAGLEIRDSFSTALLSSLNYVVKDNSSFTLNDLLNNSNAMLTYDPGQNDSLLVVRQVQEMLNQVCTRKKGYNAYALVQPTGFYDEETVQAVSNLLEGFKYVSISNIAYGAISNGANILAAITDKYPSFSLAKYRVLTRTLLTGTTGDRYDGLQDLYSDATNVMRMVIQEGERYVNYNGVSWRGRDSYSALIYQLNANSNGQVTNIVSDTNQTQGVAYTYGGIDSPESFGTKVSGNNPATVSNWYQYSNGHKPGLHSWEYAYWLQGQRNPSNFNISVWPKKTEWPEDGYGPITIKYSTEYLNPDSWPGIDCSGFVHLCAYPSGRSFFPIPTQVNKLSASMVANDNYVYNIVIPSERLSFYTNFVRKGDCLLNGDHIVIAYGDFHGTSQSDLETNNRIIHAWGGFYGNYEPVVDLFVRKTVITAFIEWGYNNPYRFARLKIWR